MSLRTLITGLAACVLLFACMSTASAQRWTPFIEPDAFDPDFQWFKPFELDSYEGLPEAEIGWFLQYDRMNVNVTRGESAPQPWDGDFTWGNRWQLGFMTEMDNGWLVEVTHIDGPTWEDINSGNYNAVEIDRVFRLEQFERGGFCEIFFGPRWTQFVDTTNTALNSRIENNMIGGQVGTRWWTQHGHWKLSAEVRGFGLQNFQFYTGDQSFDLAEFVPGGDARLEAAYSVTRDISLQVGWELTYFGRGIGRNADALDPFTFSSSEDLLITGLTFGLNFNR